MSSLTNQSFGGERPRQPLTDSLPFAATGGSWEGPARMTLPQLFDLSLRGRRDEPALEFAGQTYTFGEIDARSNRMAQYLLSRGLKRATACVSSCRTASR